MNECVIVTGMVKGGGGYYAMWANDSFIYNADTVEDAITGLLNSKYPGIWFINDEKPIAQVVEARTNVDGKK